MFSESVKSRQFIGTNKSQDIIAQTAWSTSTTERSFTATEDSWLVGLIGNKSAPGGAPETNGIVILINNIIVAECSSQSADGLIESICIPIKKGQSFSLKPLTGSWLAKLYYVDMN